MTAPFDTLGVTPISPDNPAGDDVRDDPDFDRLQTEIDKLNSPSAAASTDWDVVQRAATVLLSERGKDLLVACYLTGALMRRSGLDGLANGLTVIDDLLTHFWETLHPGLSRLRARRNALSWIVERAVQFVADKVDRDQPQERALIDTLQQHLDSIDVRLADKDPDAPSVRPLLNQIRTLPVNEAVPEAVAEAVAEAPRAAVTEHSQAPASQTPPPSPKPSAPLAIAPLSTSTIVSDADADRAFEQIAERLASLAGYRRGNRSADAQAYRLNRMAAWGGIESAPPAERGQTRIPGPIAELALALDRLQSGDAPEDTLAFAEANLLAFPFWMDLNRASAQALARAGEPFANALAEVNAATLQLLRRAPELPNLTFADGKPFADGATLEWLTSLQRNAAASSGGGAAPDALAVAVGTARSLAAAGDLEAAAIALQGATLGGNPEQRLRATIHLGELMLAHRPNAPLRPFAQMIVAEVDRHELDRWTPQLALEALSAAHALYRQNDAHAEALALVGRIGRIDAAAAVKLTLGTI
ncbi:type VI secretion system protein TssA [Caballeronia sp. LZ034LL]|uniref:type VI secretion system protein TssA n=1 Tax=Caballeronia sp. LZ034LL TaxID=3038567 RepID=UPI002863A682|nr:type VI secretion system protein TssA [Caballeronia sp. LZ034LL]MDR5837094.1 type VI secretion system protein TssA [Caballeronia sp. LZ034LL]